MCGRAVERNPYHLGGFPDYLKIRKMCEKAVENNPKVIEC